MRPDPVRPGPDRKTTCLAQLGKTIETMHHRRNPHAASPVATWAAWPFHAAALRQARHLSSSMDTLVSLGILAACGWSVYAMFVLDRGQRRLSGLANLLHDSGGGIYLEVAASVTTFLLAGRLYEAHARRRAGQAMRDLAAASAKDVCVLSEDGPEAGPEAGREQRVPASRLRAGQRFVVRPGERIAADGEVLAGQSAVDRSMMTGNRSRSTRSRVTLSPRG
jgi:P-type Cu+ transporter